MAGEMKGTIKRMKTLLEVALPLTIVAGAIGVHHDTAACKHRRSRERLVRQG
jgi:hypothetical protein